MIRMRISVWNNFTEIRRQSNVILSKERIFRTPAFQTACRKHLAEKLPLLQGAKFRTRTRTVVVHFDIVCELQKWDQTPEGCEKTDV
jgi:hypothetical protein